METCATDSGHVTIEIQTDVPIEIETDVPIEIETEVPIEIETTEGFTDCNDTVGWDENPQACRGVHNIDHSIPVKKDHYALCQLSYWDKLDTTVKAKFRLVKKCKWQRKCIVQAKRDTTLPWVKYFDVLMVSQHYMD